MVEDGELLPQLPFPFLLSAYLSPGCVVYPE